MKVFSIIALAFAFAGTAAMADELKKPSDAEIAKIKATLADIGCEGGEYDKEASGLFEVDDATCKIGPYDFKLDKDFHITVMTRD